MIIWRGFGFLVVLVGGAGALLGVGVSSLVGDGDPNGLLMGACMLLAAGGAFALGWWLNEVRPRARAQQWSQARAAELQEIVDSGRFQAVPGLVPSSHAEAQAQSQQLLERETVTVTARMRNVHTLFWIPMQWWAVLLVGLAVLMAATL